MFLNPQDALPLPVNPRLEQYDQMAEDLFKSAISKQQSALGVEESAIRNPQSAVDEIQEWSTRWVQRLAELSGLAITPGMPVEVTRWARLVGEFARQTLMKEGRPLLADAQQVIARSHGFASWARFTNWLEALKNPDSTESKFEKAADAIVNGDIATLRQLLKEEPGLVHVRSMREHGATLLHYVSANGVEGYRQKTPPNIVEITELLIEAGAEVDAACDVYGGGATTFGLAGTSVHPERAGVQAELMQLLIDYGALINHSNSAGNQQDAVNGCLANDRPQAAAFLASRGANLNLESAAGVGRLNMVKSFFNDDGSLKPTATQEEMQNGFTWACEYGHIEVVKFLLEKGANVHGNGGQTPLHLAAHRGQLEIMKLLLSRGAELEVRNPYGGTILGQTTWSVMNGDPNIDFVPVIEFLLAQGARIDEADYPTGNARVDEVLKQAIH